MGILLHVFVTVVIAGLVSYFLLSLPMSEPFKRAAYIVLVVGLVIYLGYEIGMITSLPSHMR